MLLFLANLILAFFWAALSGEISLEQLSIGFAVGYLLLLFSRRVFGASRYFSKTRLLFYFVVFFVYSLIAASLRLAFDILTPTHRMRPGIIAVPLDARTDLEITLLANLISFTPGTLSLEVSGDRKVLFVHVMYIDSGDVELVRRKIKESWERRVLELLR